VPSPEGKLVFARGEVKSDPAWHGNFRLPGPGLDDVKDPRQRDLLALALREQGLQPHEFRIEGVPGFQLKGEDRPLVVKPRNLRVDEDRSGRTTVSFELPRGAYATLVMARLVPPTRQGERGPRTERREPHRPGGARQGKFHRRGRET
jgi:tRNA(Glu) U13 pseudouridine synthase TruD